MVQLILGGIAVAVSVVAWGMFVRTVARMIRTIRLGQPDATRNGPFVPRMRNLIKEFAAHTRMAKRRSVAPWHWLVMWGFLLGSLALFEAYGEVFVPTWGWPVLDDLAPWQLLMELLGVGTVVGGIALVVVRQRNHPRRLGRRSRFAGSNLKQAYFVEAVVIVEGLGILGVRAAKAEHVPTWAAFVTNPVGHLLPSSPALVSALAFVKLMSAMVWLIVVARTMTMGVAWHRFSAFFNIYFKREPDGGVALGAVKPMTSQGKVLDFEEADPETDTFGAGAIEDFSWKGWLDFSTCTECGRCQSQCPVDIEHVDHIVDMRRYQVLIESNFPTELGGMFKNLENKGNPWGQNAKDRLAWTEGLDFDVPVFDGQLGDAEYLFWVGCAGAFEDRARKTTRAVAELLHLADVRYTVLGPEETCTGDPARRAGNEFLFQMLAQQNVETLNAVFEGAAQRKIVVTCAHCFNSLANEYPQLGGRYEVVHHTQLLNRLVREKRLVPVAPIAQDVTYHDPCYLGRHNKIYDAPRELVGATGAQLREMPRHADTAMCCGAGGARMWMEERIGKRINTSRVEEALGTAPTKIATGCPFCRVMLTDGLAEKQAAGAAPEHVEVLDVAQLLLASVTRRRRATPTSAAPTPSNATPAAR
jgi:Fe-S oxidoreductase